MAKDGHQTLPRLGSALKALRERLGVTQAELAGAMELNQPDISRIERQADMRVSTVRAYLRALGARLEVAAAFGSPRRRERVTVYVSPVKEKE